MKIKSLAAFALLGTPLLASAHPFHGDTASFNSGLNHPLHGWDHILAMVAVGLWAAQLGGRARWAVPASFVGVMIVGGALGMAGIHLPLVEAGILFSVIALGFLILTAARLPVVAAAAVVGVFALFHGYAHGAELPAAASGFKFSLGFVLATALLHALGLGLGLFARETGAKSAIRLPMLRIAGAAIVVAGICLCFGA